MSDDFKSAIRHIVDIHQKQVNVREKLIKSQQETIQKLQKNLEMLEADKHRLSLENKQLTDNLRTLRESALELDSFRRVLVSLSPDSLSYQWSMLKG